MTPAIDKMERRLASLEKQIEAALDDAANLPAVWERMLTSAGELVDRIVAAYAQARARAGARA